MVENNFDKFLKDGQRQYSYYSFFEEHLRLAELENRSSMLLLVSTLILALFTLIFVMVFSM